MSLPVSPAIPLNDPEQIPSGSPWMRGFTPARLRTVALVCILFHANNPSFFGDNFLLRVGRTLHNAGLLDEFITFLHDAIPRLRGNERAEAT